MENKGLRPSRVDSCHKGDSDFSKRTLIPRKKKEEDEESKVVELLNGL